MRSAFWLVPESSFQNILDINLGTHRPCCGYVSNTGDWGLLWGTEKCLFVRTVTASSKGIGWNWGWPRPLSSPNPHLRVISRKPWRQVVSTTPPSSGACCRRHSEAALLLFVYWNSIFGGIYVLQTGRQGTTSSYLFHEADSAEWTWKVSAWNLSFL